MAFNYEFPYTDPNFYNDDWLLSKMKEILSWMEETDKWKDEFETAYKDLKILIAEIEAGVFPGPIKNAFYKWMQENAIDLVGQMVHNVFFGLTDDGHFVAYIPESWADISFNTTDYDIILSEHPEYGYGHLVLSY